MHMYTKTILEISGLNNKIKLKGAFMKKVFDVEFYSQLLDKINANIYITDVETDEIVYMNDAMKQTFGLENRRAVSAGKSFKRE